MTARLKAAFDRALTWTASDPMRAAVAFLAGAVVILALLLVGTCAARAADVTVSWTMPTLNTDGSAIPATGAGSVSSTQVDYGSCSGTLFGVKAGGASIAAPATTTQFVGLGPQTWCFRAAVTNSYGVQSVFTAAVSKVVPAPTPNPPVLAVPVIAGMLQTPVYSVAANGNMSTFVGFVDVGATCSGPVLFTYRTKSFREVPRASVKLWGTTSLRLAAPCA